MNLTYGSLCTGYDGIGAGLELAGFTLDRKFSAEVEPSVSEVLKVEHPDVPNVGDIKTLDWAWQWPKIDILSSGDPCQSISIAGRKLGREDPRFLWPWVRLAYQNLKPRYIFLENVANMTSHDGGQTMAERFEHLREDGYTVRWTIIGACAVGAPHHRHRWYALAAYVGPGAPEAVRIGEKAICGAPRSGGRNVLPTPNAREGGERGFPSREHAQRRADSPERSMNLEDAIALLPAPCARDGKGRNEGDPEFWHRKFERMPDRAGKGIPLGAAVNLLPTPRATDVGTAGRRSSEGWRPQLGQAVQSLLPTPRATVGPVGGPGQRGSSGDLAMPSACQPERWGKYTGAIALWEEITGVSAPVPTVPGPNGGVRLNPELPEWMMGLRPGLLSGRMSRNDALKAAGNGVVPLQAAVAWQMLTKGKV